MCIIGNTVNSQEFRPLSDFGSLLLFCKIINGKSGPPLLYRWLPFHNMDLAVNLADTTSTAFSENMTHTEPIKIVSIKKCPKLLKTYGKQDHETLHSGKGVMTREGSRVKGS